MPSVNGDFGVVDAAEIRPFAEVAKGYTYFEKGDVLFAKITPCMQNGKHAVAGNLIDGFGFGSTEFHVLRPRNGLLSDWLHLFLRQKSILEAAERILTGAVGQQRVPEEFLANLEIPLPDENTQRSEITRLRERLHETTVAVLACRGQLKNSLVFPSAILRDAFDGHNPITVSRVASWQSWTAKPLHELARLESGHTPSRRHPDWWGGHVPWLSLTDIRKLHGTYAYETGEYTNDAGIANSSARLLPLDTVCVSRTASIGFVTILGRPMATSQDFCNWICNPEKLDPEFLMYAFMASQNYLNELGSGAVHKTIYMPTIESFHVCAPEVAEQRRIARMVRERLDAIQALIEGLKTHLVEIELLPQRMLAAAFDQFR